MIYLAAYSAIGACAGILAGLLGVGGGIIIVPLLVFLFTAQGFPAPIILHIALGTSLASIMFTSLSSMSAHHRRGAVIWPTVVRISPGICTGTLAGSWVAARMSSQSLKGFFVVFIYYVALQMLLDIKPKPHRQLPGTAGMFGVGGVIGGISSLVGIGGGSMSVPFLLWCNTPLHRSIGTSAAIGFPIALAGTIGYAFNGHNLATLPPFSIGFIFLPALCCISIASILTAPLGAWMAHSLPAARLKKIFACLLILIGTKLLSGLL